MGKFNLNKPFKPKTRSKRYTIMLVPDSSAKIRRISIPYWVLGFVAVPILLIAIIVVLFQSRVVEVGMLADHYEGRIRDSAGRLSDIIDEKDRLEETLALTANLLEMSESELETVLTQLSSYEEQLTPIFDKINDVDQLQQNIITIFHELQALEIPYAFDETRLLSSSATPAGGAFPVGHSVLADMDFLIESRIHDLQQLEDFSEELLEYLRARPSGLPVPGGTVGPGFGPRRNPFTGIGIEMHEGVDIGAKLGDGIYATADGVVSYAEWNSGGYGFLVVIDHANGYSTYYAHNSHLLVQKGEEVTRGQLIALAGSTGRSTAVHCHYEVRKDGVPLNPRLFMRND